jgi:hypothetical protein
MPSLAEFQEKNLKRTKYLEVQPENNILKGTLIYKTHTKED